MKTQTVLNRVIQCFTVFLVFRGFVHRCAALCAARDNYLRAFALKIAPLPC